jgi:hypothetical protein
MAFQALANAVYYNALAWRLQGSSTYSSNAVSFIKTWFLDPDTRMNPNLNFAQVIRGPGSYYGAHTGILCVLCRSAFVPALIGVIFLDSDLKCMAQVKRGRFIAAGAH